MTHRAHASNSGFYVRLLHGFYVRFLHCVEFPLAHARVPNYVRLCGFYTASSFLLLMLACRITMRRVSSYSFSRAELRLAVPATGPYWPSAIYKYHHEYHTPLTKSPLLPHTRPSPRGQLWPRA